MAIGRRLSILGAMVCVLVTSFGLASAQSVSSGTIHGTVRDESGGVLPGVTATLHEPCASGPRDRPGDRRRRRVSLRRSSRRDLLLKFELTGFSTLIREDLRLTIGFTARVDESMKVGAMSESVTVSGQSPIVDITSTSASVAFTKEILEAVPRGRDLQNVLAMAPGVTQATMDVGGSTLAQRQDTASYGMESQPKLQYEGMNIAMGADQNTPDLLHRQQPRRGAGPHIGQRRRGVDARRLHDCDHEVGEQHLSWVVPRFISAVQSSRRTT